MTIKVRRTRDLETVEQLNQEIFPYDDDLDLDARWWLATVNGEPAGFCGYRTLHAPGGRPLAYFHRAGVLPEYRGLGLHSRLIQVRLSDARRKDYDLAITYTTTYNPASANNLIDAGFRQYLPAYMWGGPDMLYWRLAL